MKITRTSILTGNVHTREIPVTEIQLQLWERSNRAIQDMLPRLTADDREFLLTGITPDEWKDAFGNDED